MARKKKYESLQDYEGEGLEVSRCYPDSFRPFAGYAQYGEDDAAEQAIWEEFNIGISCTDGFTVLMFPNVGAYEQAKTGIAALKDYTAVRNPDDSVAVWFHWPSWQDHSNLYLKAYDSRLVCRRYVTPAPPSHVMGSMTEFLNLGDPLVREWADPPIAEGKVFNAKPFSLQATSLRGMMAFEPEEQPMYIEGGLLDAKGRMMIAGIPKAGKTRLGMNLAFSLVTGRPFLGFQTLMHPCTLMLQFEVSEWRFRQRVISVANAMKIPVDNNLPVYFETLRSLRLDTSGAGEGVRQFRKLVKTFGAEVVILDPMVKIHSGDEREQGEMQVLLNVIDELAEDLDVAIVLIHHLNKRSEGEAWTKIRGSSYIPAWADALLILDQTSRDAKPTVQAILRNGEDWKKAITFEKDHTVKVIGDMQTTIEVDILETVWADPGASRKDIAAIISRRYNIDVREVYTIMRRMENDRSIMLPK